jgi:hypothetical protein
MGRHPRPSRASKIEKRLKGNGGLPLVEALATVCAGAVIVMGVMSPSTEGREGGSRAPLYTATDNENPSLDEDRMDASVFRYGLGGSCDFAGIEDLSDTDSGDRIQINLRLTENPYMDEIRLRRGSALTFEPTTAVVNLLTPRPGADKKDAQITNVPAEFIMSANGQTASIETVVPKEMAPGMRVAVALGNGATTTETMTGGDITAQYSYSEQFCWSVANGQPDPYDPVYFHPFHPLLEVLGEQAVQ